MSGTLDIDLLRTFVAFADTGSFTGAAQLVHRTQSAVSMQMRRLEDLSGKALFERSGRQRVLTADGMTLLGYARRILTLHDEAVTRFAEPEIAGTVTVGTPDDYANTLLPLLFSRFAETYPRVHLEIRCEQSPQLLTALDAGTLDLALISRDPGADDGLVLGREPVVWATSPQHMAHALDPITLALFLQDCKLHQWAIAALDAAGKPYRVAYTSPSLSALTAAVDSGLAVTAIAQSSLSQGMRVLGEKDGFPQLPMVDIALVLGRRADSEAGKRLAEHIIDTFRQDAAA